MGYKRQRKVYRLTFPEYDGLVVTARSLSLRQLKDMQRDIGKASEAETDGEDRVIDVLLNWFCRAWISWNLEEEDGTPVPKTREALEDEDIDLATNIINAWQRAMDGPDEDLGKESPSGETWPEVSIPMAPL